MKAVVFASSLVLLMLSFVSCHEAPQVRYGSSGFISTFYRYLKDGGRPVDNLNKGLHELCKLVDEAEWQRTQDVAERPQKARGCQNRDIVLECPLGKGIQVLAANQGRTSASVCDATLLNGSGSSDDTSSCQKNDKVWFVKNRCEEQRRCQFEVEKEVSCPDVYLYLEVDYNCVKEKTAQTADACQGNKLELKCNFGERIHVKGANFGRMVNTQRCRVINFDLEFPCISDVTDIVVTQCEDLRMCIIPVIDLPKSNCTVKRNEYLEVQYTCEKAPVTTHCANGRIMGMGENQGFSGHGYFDPRNWVRILQKMVEETLAPDSSTG